MPQPNRYVTARLSVRRGTKDQWEQQDTVLLEGEPGWEVDTERLKIGDGVNSWSSLNYLKFGDSEAAGSVIHDGTVLPSHINSVSSAIEYFGAKFLIYDNHGKDEFIAGLLGHSALHILTVASGSGGLATFSGESAPDNSGSDLIEGQRVRVLWASHPYTGQIGRAVSIGIDGFTVDYDNPPDGIREQGGGLQLSDEGTGWEKVFSDNIFLDGTEVQLTATPFAGYEFDYWIGNVADTSAQATTITLTKDEYVRANFKLITP